jgi:hypothetical protein
MDHLDAQIVQKRAMEEARRQAEEAKKNGTQASTVAAETKAEYKVRRTRNVSIKQMTGTASWRLESAEDIDKHLAELRKALIAQMDEDTIVNVEF